MGEEGTVQKKMRIVKRWWGKDKRNSGTESPVRGNERQRRETTVEVEG